MTPNGVWGGFNRPRGFGLALEGVPTVRSQQQRLPQHLDHGGLSSATWLAL